MGREMRGWRVDQSESGGRVLFVLSAPSPSPLDEKRDGGDGRGERSSRPGGRSGRPQTWWTVDARAPEPEREADEGSVRAVALILGLLDMHLASTWEVVQL